MGSPEERRSTPPLVIRGHHLYAFAELLRTNMTVEQLAEEVTEDILGSKKIRNGETTDEIDVVYIEDVLGKTLEDRRRFTLAQVPLFRAFIELPDNFPVELGIGKDNMCDTCIVGDHCLKQQDDKNAILDFLLEFIKANRGVRLPIQDPRFRVLTTLGVVRSVLKSPFYGDTPVTFGSFL